MICIRDPRASLANTRFRPWYSGLCLLAVCALLLVAGPASAQDSTIEVEPGLWRFTNAFSMPGMPEGQGDTTSTECLTEKTAQLNLDAMLREMTGPEGTCAVSNLVDQPGTVALDIDCEVEEGGMTLRSTGHMRYTYSATAFEGGVEGVIVMQGQEVPYSGRGTGTRIGECS